MLKFNESKNIFLTSDTHFGHKKIIEYCNRPFSSVEEMNEGLIENWNKVVPEDGIVFHLGDFALGGSSTWAQVAPRLNGHIHLILGNHDAKNFRPGYLPYFESVQEQLTIEIGRKALILTHFPLLCYHGTWGNESNIWNIHGHTHLCKSNNTGADLNRMGLTYPTQYDVGVDFNDYKPIPFSELEEIIDTQIKNKTNQLFWINGEYMRE